MFEDIGNIVNAIGNLIIQMCVCVCTWYIYKKEKILKSSYILILVSNNNY